MKEKSVLESDGGDFLRSEPKRKRAPALASVVIEALKVNSLQKLCSSLEPILRRIVSEEVERALVKLGPTRIGGRTSPKRIEGPSGRKLQLHFRSTLSLSLFTGGKVEGEQGSAIHVVLLDASTGRVVTLGPESSAKLDVVVLEGDFNNEDDDDWTEEEFESHIVKEREGKRPLLTGDLQISLKEGLGTLGELTFTDNSSWIRSRKFRLGLKISSGFLEGIRIREAKTEAFTVKDHRGELYKKHYPPSWKDEVWRLEKIGKDGSFHKKLNNSQIFTVEDFLRLYVREPQKLRSILGGGMSNKMWESLIEHAKTCLLSGKYYVYYSDDTRDIGAIFNHIYEFSGLVAGGQFCSAESLTDSQKVFADALVKRAYENWSYVVEYDGKALVGSKAVKKTMTTRSEVSASASASTNFSSSYDQQTSQQLSISEPTIQSSVDTGLAARGETSSDRYDDHRMTRYSNSQLVGSDSQLDYETTLPQQNPFSASAIAQDSQYDSIGLALAPPQYSNMGFQLAGQSLSYDDWSYQRQSNGGTADDFLTEEEIRLRSHEILEHEDMQLLLRHLSMAGASSNIPEDGYGYPPYMPSPNPPFNFNEEQTRSSGKAVVGWLKIKAAMRWGIFIRKQVAEKRRARLVELED